MPKHLIAALLMLMACPLVAEAKEPLATDRPDIAETSQSVGRGVYQIEQALQPETTGGVTSWLFPSLHRFGLTDRFELRLETPLMSLTGGRPSFDELAFGGKYHWIDGGEWGGLPSVALLGHANVNAAGSLEPIAKVLIDTSLPGGFDLGVNLGATWGAGNAAPTPIFAGALAYYFTDALRAYGEVSGEQDLSGGQNVLGVDGGLVYLVNDDLQLDVAAYKGLTAAATDWYVTAGISVRYGLFE